MYFNSIRWSLIARWRKMASKAWNTTNVSSSRGWRPTHSAKSSHSTATLTTLLSTSTTETSASWVRKTSGVKTAHFGWGDSFCDGALTTHNKNLLKWCDLITNFGNVSFDWFSLWCRLNQHVLLNAWCSLLTMVVVLLLQRVWLFEPDHSQTVWCGQQFPETHRCWVKGHQSPFQHGWKWSASAGPGSFHLVSDPKCLFFIWFVLCI